MDKIRLTGIIRESYADGPGIRLALFAQGCHRACIRCHNPESWPLDGGKEYDMRKILRMIRQPGESGKPIQGVTFSGGEPFLQAAPLTLAAYEAHRVGWDVCTYTGYFYEDLIDNPDADVRALLNI